MSGLYGRPGSLRAALRQAVHEALLAREGNPDELPTSNRFIFYELRGVGLDRGRAPSRGVVVTPLPGPPVAVGGPKRGAGGS